MCNPRNDDGQIDPWDAVGRQKQMDEFYRSLPHRRVSENVTRYPPIVPFLIICCAVLFTIGVAAAFWP